MTKVPQMAGKVTNQNEQIRQVMILADRPALFDRDGAELAEAAHHLGLRIEIERFDLEENKYSRFVLS